MADDDYIIEYTVAGKSVKVTAIDPHTMKEVSIVGASSVSKKQLAKLAVRKLEYVLKKNES